METIEITSHDLQHAVTRKKAVNPDRVCVNALILKAGGGGRTRTYEGLASGFTVRPLCRSGHSPMPQDQVSRTKTPRAGRGGLRQGLCCLTARPVHWKYDRDRTARRRDCRASM